MASKLTDEQKEPDDRAGSMQDPFAYQRLVASSLPCPSANCRLAEEHGVVSVWGTDLNHSIRDYEKVLRLGFSGLKAEVESALAGAVACRS